MEFSRIKKGRFSFVYLSRENCSVCHAILPKIEELMVRYPKGELSTIDLDKVPSAAGEFMVFSIPALIVYSEGKELYRTARFFNFNELEVKLNKYYAMIF